MKFPLSTRDEQIAAEVGNTAGGIGYVGLAYLKASGVKPVAIDGKLPSVDTVRERAYPLSARRISTPAPTRRPRRRASWRSRSVQPGRRLRSRWGS